MQENLKTHIIPTEENIIKFSHNWNDGKLNCHFFTTIRKPDVFTYYSSRVGDRFNVMLDGKFFCTSTLVDATLTSIDKITPELLVLDTGTKDYKKLFEKFNVVDACVLLLFERVK